MEQCLQRRGRGKFLASLDDNPFIDTAANAVLFGLDPYEVVLDRDITEYSITLGVLQKANKLSNERKIEEMKVLATLIGNEFIKGLSKVF